MTSDFKEYDNLETWWENNGAIKQHKFYVTAMLNFKGNNEKTQIGLDYYPLNKNENYEIFNSSNTKFIDMTNEDYEKIINIVDSVKIMRGRCYTMSKILCDKFVEAGYKAYTYVGWVLLGDRNPPMHNAWVVIETENGKSVIDLIDDYFCLFEANKDIFASAETPEEVQQLIDGFYEFVEKDGIPNSIRCFPLGVPSKDIYYVGTKCDVYEGLNTYLNLLKQFPNHESMNINKDDMNIFS